MVPQINGPQNVASRHSTHSPRKALEITASPHLSSCIRALGVSWAVCARKSPPGAVMPPKIEKGCLRRAGPAAEPASRAQEQLGASVPDHRRLSRARVPEDGVTRSGHRHEYCHALQAGEAAVEKLPPSERLPPTRQGPGVASHPQGQPLGTRHTPSSGE